MVLGDKCAHSGRVRRRYEKWFKGDGIEDCTLKQRYEASYQSIVKVLQQNTSIVHRKFLKSCVRARAEQGLGRTTQNKTKNKKIEHIELPAKLLD